MPREKSKKETKRKVLSPDTKLARKLVRRHKKKMEKQEGKEKKLSAYQQFVKEHYSDAGCQSIPAKERFTYLASLWRDRKKGSNSSS